MLSKVQVQGQDSHFFLGEVCCSLNVCSQGKRLPATGQISLPGKHWPDDTGKGKSVHPSQGLISLEDLVHHRSSLYLVTYRHRAFVDNWARAVCSGSTSGQCRVPFALSRHIALSKSCLVHRSTCKGAIPLRAACPR